MLTSEMIRPDGALVQVSDLEVTPFGPAVEVKNENERVIISGVHGAMILQWAGDHSVRISGVRSSRAEIGGLPSYAAVLPCGGPESSLETLETEHAIEVSSGQLRVRIEKQTMSFIITDPAGNALTNRHQYYTGDNHLQCRGGVTDGAQIYGLGETTGFLNKRGERYTMWNSDVYAPHVADMESLYQSIPVLVHHHEGKAFGLFVDNPGKITFDMRANREHFRIDLETGDLDCYFMAGPSLKDVVSRYTALTGRMDMPPLWAAGYQQSRYSYMSQEEVLELARTFRAKEIPCDAIYLDIHYMDEFRVFTFDPVRFPDPKGMITELRNLGIRVVPIVDPGVKMDEQYGVYRDGDRRDYFCKTKEGLSFQGEVWPGISVFPDFSDAEASRWWGDLHRFYADLGISGIWNDMNEPSVFACESKTMDPDVVHGNNGMPITHGQWHNMYGLGMSKATYEGMERALNGERPFVLTRAGYAGIQRYAAVWTGDNRSFWEHLAMFMPMSMNLGMSGIAFCGSDIGGFEHSTTGELLVRWTQMGAFSPLCRNHSAYKTLYQEPWRFGPEVEEICRKYISLRYRLLPYLYTAFYEASQSGLPIIRSLAMEFPEDPRGYAVSDQFMYGDSLLIAPVYRPETEHRVVYFPPGEWIDFATGERLEGGQHRMVHAPLEVLPIYVKAGSFIPMTSPEQHTSDAGWRDLIMCYFSGAGDFSSEYTLYEDDGSTSRYRQGQYNTLIFGAEEQELTLRLTYRYEHQAYDNRRKSVLLVIKNMASMPKSIEGLELIGSVSELEQVHQGWAYDALRKECHIRIPQQQLWEVVLNK